MISADSGYIVFHISFGLHQGTASAVPKAVCFRAGLQPLFTVAEAVIVVGTCGTTEVVP